MQSLWRRWFGDAGEREAVRFLKRRGYRVLARQYRTPHGEIDLIAADGLAVVFVEVKTRRSDAKGSPVEAVTPGKQVRLTKLALAYLKRRRWLDRSARFDIIAVTWPEGSSAPRVEHFIDAFPSALDAGLY